MNFVGRGRADASYYQWLIEMAGVNRPPYLDYLLLMQELHKRPFVWSIPMDSNRAMDGFSLRKRYAEENGYILPTDENGDMMSVSVLEVLLALSLRIDTEIMGEPGVVYPERWFWVMMENLKLTICTDDHFDKHYVEQQLDIWLEKKYKRNGQGGLFPLKKPFGDQRQTEIWQQMQEYLNENYSMF